MQIQVTGQQMEITPALRDYAVSKIEKITRLFDNTTGAHVVLSVDKHAHKAECRLSVPGKQLFAEVAAHDMYAAIDGLVDRMEMQVRKYKGKLTDHHGQARRAASDL